jgi:tetratricopeptide (TPR) repeat protein
MARIIQLKRIHIKIETNERINFHPIINNDKIPLEFSKMLGRRGNMKRLLRSCKQLKTLKTPKSTSPSNFLIRAMSSLHPPRHNHADTKVGVGLLPLSPEEIEAEKELLKMLPDFQLAMDILQGNGEHIKSLPDSKRASMAVPHLQRTVEICRSAMGFNSEFLLASLRHLFLTHFIEGNYKLAEKTMHERGEIMQWPVTEQERLVRLFLRENQPSFGFDWYKNEVFTTLFPNDETLPLKWTIYDFIGKSMKYGNDGLQLEDPLFTQAVEVLRRKKDLAKKNEFDLTDNNVITHEIPYLLSQYGSLCLVSSDALQKPLEELSDRERICLDQTETLWKEALEWVEERTSGDNSFDESTASVDGPFEAYIQTNLGELLLHRRKSDEAMEYLGKALKTQQKHKGGNNFGLSRVLLNIAIGCHAVGQAVSSEGLFTTVLESYEKEPFLSLPKKMEYAKALRAYGHLLQNWEKRETTAQYKFNHAQELFDEIREECSEIKCERPLDPIFYLPL